MKLPDCNVYIGDKLIAPATQVNYESEPARLVQCADAAQLLVHLLESNLRGIGTEDEVQRAIEALLTKHEIKFAREVRLNRADRIDFMIDGMIGVEVKVGGSLSAVIRQLHRYAQVEAIKELVLVTTKVALARVPREINGKRVSVAALLGGIV